MYRRQYTDQVLAINNFDVWPSFLKHDAKFVNQRLHYTHLTMKQKKLYKLQKNKQ